MPIMFVRAVLPVRRQNNSMLKLGVNIDHVATLREARYRGCERGEPDPVAAALICEAAGAHGITAHLREDRRHIQDRDVWQLLKKIKTRLNLEMANSPEIVALALKLKPDIICIEVSMFIAPDAKQIEASAKAGAQFVELHTGAYAEHFCTKRERNVEVERLVAGAEQAHDLGLRVNAGHGLNYENLPLLHFVPYLVELNIGHSIVSRSVTVGLAKAVKEMLQLMKGYRN